MSEQPPPKPEIAPPVWDNIPRELATRKQWVLWKFEWPETKPGRKAPTKWQKIPYYVRGGRRAGGQGEESDLRRLGTLDEVRQRFEQDAKWDGVGFGFLPSDGMIAIDIDRAIDVDTGEVSQRCLGIVAACRSYTEFSPSGTGCHIIGYGTTESKKHNGIGVEMFCGSQFFTVTGRLWPNGFTEAAELSELVIQGLHAMIAAAKDADKVKPEAPSQPDRPPAQQRASGGARTESVDQLRGRVQAALDFLSSDIGYNDWLAVGWALRDAFGEDGFPMWDGWSSKGSSYQGEEDLRSHWKSFKRGTKPPDEVVGIIFARARDAGWKPPQAVRAPKKPRANKSAPAGGANAPGDGGNAGGGDSTGGGGGDDGPPNDFASSADDGTEPELFQHRGRPVDCRENVLYCLRDDPNLRGLARLNTFTELHERARDTPWGRGPGEWDEEDDLMLGEHLAQRFGLLTKAASTLRNGVLMAARQHKFNPIIDLIKSQAWDGTPRLDHWLSDVFEVEDRPYTRLIGRCFIMGMVMRAMRPGCKFDYMLILKGDQGLKKSGAFRALAEPWFTDNAIKVGEKDSIMAMQLVWIAESAELESLNKSETTAVKQFLSAQEDLFRPPYGAQVKKRPRHTVMGGTTNADTFLKDATGDRRFWPLEVFAVNLEALRNIRLQLFAEALHRLKAKEQYWPSREQERDLVFPEQERFKKVESWEDYLDAYVNAPDHDKLDKLTEAQPRGKREFFTTVELYDKALNIKADRIDGAGQMDTRIGNAMKALGFVRHRATTGQPRPRGWLRVKKEEPPAPATDQDPSAPDAPPVTHGPDYEPLPF